MIAQVGRQNYNLDYKLLCISYPSPATSFVTNHMTVVEFYSSDVKISQIVSRQMYFIVQDRKLKPGLSM